MIIDFTLTNAFKLGDAETKLVAEPNGYLLLFAGFLMSLASSKYANKEGSTLAGLKLRSFGRLIDKLETSASNEIDLEKADLDILKDIFLSEDVKVMPQAARLFVYYRDKIEKALVEPPPQN